MPELDLLLDIKFALRYGIICVYLFFFLFVCFSSFALEWLSGRKILIYFNPFKFTFRVKAF